MTENRLIGTWRSDGTRTRRELEARRDLSLKARRQLSGLIGRLELPFTRTRCHVTLDGETDKQPYRVVAKDDSSVAIVSPSLLDGRQLITHVHFVGNSIFWIHVGTGVFREFFRRVPNHQPPPTVRTN